MHERKKTGGKMGRESREPTVSIDGIHARKKDTFSDPISYCDICKGIKVELNIKGEALYVDGGVYCDCE